MRKLGNERYHSFLIGYRVLKNRVEIGRLNVNKLKDKYEGPYVVKRIWTNGLIYVFEQVDENGKITELRPHQNQLHRCRKHLCTSCDILVGRRMQYIS